VQVTFLGTGTSGGVPFIGCDCEVCTSADKRDTRLRSSVWIQTPEASIIIDTGPDFRYQVLRAKVKTLDAIIFTHAHKDHIAGLDDVRAYNFHSGKEMEIYATEPTQDALKREFSYVFQDFKYPGIPLLNLNTISADKPFTVMGITVTPILVMHYKLEVLGFRIGDFTYITDANYIAPGEMKKAEGSKVLVLNALRHQQHISHYTLSEAIEVSQAIKAENTYFTHISHQLGLHKAIEKELPPNMHLAYDGLTLNL
jgi:phosphoribosyl 1,2-cyclic phosphate phosphodiesterase